MIKLSDYVMQRVAQAGVKHVFLVPGGGAMHLNDSLGKQPGLEYVSNLHEQASSIAAEAYARVTNQLGVAMVTCGPGGTNAVTGCAGAFLDSTPCLFLSGQVKRADLKRDTGVRQLGVQEIDIVSIVKSITKYAVTVLEPSKIRYELEKALHLATTGRKGPVWLDLPLDVQGATIDDPDALEPFVPPAVEARPPQLAADVARAIELLNRAERPVILAGNGIRLAGAERRFLALVERLRIPVLTTWLGLDLIGQDHELFAGRPGSVAPRGANFALQNSDCLISIGSRLDMALTGYAHDRLARAATKVIVDIDPAEIAKMQMRVDQPVIADAGLFLDELERQSSKIEKRDRSAWLTRCQEWKARYPLVLDEHRNRAERVSTYHFSDTLSDVLQADDVVVPCSSGAAIEIFFLCFKTKAGQRIFHNRGLGAMGFALPASIGACLASGRRRTICVDGDGGWQFNIQELATVREHNLPIKFFVLNNEGYASIRTSQTRYFQRLVGADSQSGLKLPDTLKIAEAYGLKTARIGQAANLREQILAVLAMDGPVVCEVLSPADETRAPSLLSIKKPDGSMVSKPLEDLWPFLDRDEFRSNMIVPPLPE